MLVWWQAKRYTQFFFRLPCEIIEVMDQLFEFIGNHWYLVAIWAIFVIALLWDNSQRSGGSVSIAEATQLINKESALVLDIREKSEFTAGHLANAKNIPYAKLANRLGELEAYRKSPIILVCKNGQTVGVAGKMLKEKGFTAVRLKGGMLEWSNQNLPLVKS